MSSPYRAGSPPETRPRRSLGLRGWLVLLLGLSGWAVWSAWGDRLGRVGGEAGIVEGQGAPPPSLWRLELEAPPAPAGVDQGWATLKHFTYAYEVACPPGWLVSSPGGFSKDRARLLLAPAPSQARLVVIPWGIYDRPVEEEIAKAEGGWLLSGVGVSAASRISSSSRQVGSRPASSRRYRATLERAEGGIAPWEAWVTFVVARPKCYALALLVPEAEVRAGGEALQALYERVVRSFVALAPDGHGVDPGAGDSPAPGAAPSQARPGEGGPGATLTSPPRRQPASLRGSAARGVPDPVGSGPAA